MAMNQKNYMALLTALLLSATTFTEPGMSLHADAAMTGDLNGNGIIEIDDAAQILKLYAKYAAGLLSSEDVAFPPAADVDQDSFCTIKDATYTLQYYAQSAAGLSPTWESILDSATNSPPSPTEPTTPEMQETFGTPQAELAVMNQAAELRWIPIRDANGYEIFRSDWYYGTYTQIAELPDATISSYKDSGIDNDTTYYYYIRAYRYDEAGGKVYSEPSESFGTNDAECILNAAKPLVPRRSYLCYNVQGMTTTTSTYTISDHDIALMDQFAAEHFTEEMSQAEKLYITLDWINKNVTYATTSALWAKISGKSFTEAVFEVKVGQCAQSNGAMAAMMAYLGYDAYLIQGWRGNWASGSYWSHFWCEVNIGDRLYIMETGNYGQDGGWSYFLTPYPYTKKYIKNGVNLGG